ncbi:MAG: SEC-C metal-binding domain-containing protein [Chloroflexota bacterium]
MFRKIVNAVMGDPTKKEINKLMPEVDEVNALEDEMKGKSDDDLKQMMVDFKAEIQEETKEAREELERLEQEAFAAYGEDRQRLEVAVERAQKALLDLEAKLLFEIRPEVFAAVREAAVRTIDHRHYDVQIVGSILLHEGRVVEMRTGEGKTLVGTMPLVLNALTGHGAHLITPNDYLSKIGVQKMGAVYHRLGLSVAVIQNAGGGGVDNASFVYDPDYQASDDRYQNLRPVTRRQAYEADITYGTNNEFGFDYLRDNMVRDLKEVSQLNRHYAIIDEVDNILIDEARTPLIISGKAEESSELYFKFAQIVRPLQGSSEQSIEDKEPDGDFVVDEKTRNSYLTEQGIDKVERALGIQSDEEDGGLYGAENAPMTPYLDNALRAKALFSRDKEYVVQDGEVVIIDEFTGRMMHGRRYSEGLHQAIEAKENLRVQNESFTWATITFQNFFRMYNKLAGMTGTAVTEAEEFGKIYDLEVSALPTNVEFRAMQGSLISETKKVEGAQATTYHNDETNEFYHKRIDFPDVVYRSPEIKYRAVINEIEEVHKTGQPILVGTVAIETSELIAKMLNKRKIKHEVLNAKNHEREATIITQAGRPGSVTIATNMAGRGVDILLGGNPEGLARDQLRRQGIDLTEVEPGVWDEALAEATATVESDSKKVHELGGLHVIGTERHEARRIDNQLRGRAGRQGDPGSSRFFVSMQDDLMRRFGGQNVANLMERFGLEDDMPIEAGVVSRSIETAQTKVEGHNFDIRKHVLEYDDVVNQQREIIYAQRKRILTSPSLKENILSMVYDEIDGLVNQHTIEEYSEDWDVAGLYNAVRTIIPLPATMTSESWRLMEREELTETFHDLVDAHYQEREEHIGAEVLRQIEKLVMLETVDRLWVRHLTALDSLRVGIGLRAYGQQDPLVAYKREALDMYEMLVAEIQQTVTSRILRLEVAPQQREEPKNLQARHDSLASQTTATAGAGQEQSRTPIRVTKRPGRNDPCWCGSGKKYKSCHMRTDNVGANGDARPAAPKNGQQQVNGKAKGKAKKKAKQR